jgi:hypothetical protein
MALEWRRDNQAGNVFGDDLLDAFMCSLSLPRVKWLLAIILQGMEWLLRVLLPTSVLIHMLFFTQKKNRVRILICVCVPQ